MIKLFNPQPNFAYPLMRDPKCNPRCYELTDKEREEAVNQAARLLQPQRCAIAASNNATL